MIVLSSAEWRRQFATRIPEAAERQVPLVYTSHRRPIVAVLLTPPKARSERLEEFQTLTHIFNMVFGRAVSQPATERPPTIRINDLRRDVNQTWQYLLYQPRPHMLTRYWDAIGYVVPIPSGATLEQVKELGERFFGNGTQ